MSKIHPLVRTASKKAAEKFRVDDFLLPEIASRLRLYRDDKLVEQGKDPAVVMGKNGESIDAVMHQLRAESTHAWAFPGELELSEPNELPDMSHINPNNTVERIAMCYENNAVKKKEGKRTRPPIRLNLPDNASPEQKLEAYFDTAKDM